MTLHNSLSFRVCDPSVLRKLESTPKDLCLSWWWRCSIWYGCTGRRGSESLDYNECMRRRSPPMSQWFFLSVEHAFPRQQTSVSPPPAPINCVSGVNDHRRRLPNSQCLYCFHGPFAEVILVLGKLNLIVLIKKKRTPEFVCEGLRLYIGGLYQVLCGIRVALS